MWVVWSPTLCPGASQKMIIWLEVLFKKVKNLYILDILIYSSLNWPQLFYAFYWCNLDNYGLELNQKKLKKSKNIKVLCFAH